MSHSLFVALASAASAAAYKLSAAAAASALNSGSSLPAQSMAAPNLISPLKYMLFTTSLASVPYFFQTDFIYFLLAQCEPTSPGLGLAPLMMLGLPCTGGRLPN